VFIPDEDGSRNRQLLGILAGCAVGSVALVGILILVFRRPADSRPENPRSPLAVRQPQTVIRPKPVARADPEVARGDPRPALKSPPTEVKPEPPRPPPEPESRPVARPHPEPATGREIKTYPPLEPGRRIYGEYHLQKISGFTVYVNRTVFDEAAQSENRPLDCLQDELEQIGVVLRDPKVIKALQTVKVFVEWDHVETGYAHSVGVFYSGEGNWLGTRGVIPQKAGQVTILSLKRIAETKMRNLAPRKGVVILHELAHAVHYYTLRYNNPVVRNAYEQAMTRGLYRSVPDERRGTVQAYAATNEHEYFAEVSCAYLDYCDYYPHDRSDLHDYDSVGYELMRKVWGDRPEQSKVRLKR